MAAKVAMETVPCFNHATQTVVQVSAVIGLKLVDHRTDIAEVMGSNPVEALNFFGILYSNCSNWKFTCLSLSS